MIRTDSKLTYADRRMRCTHCDVYDERWYVHDNEHPVCLDCDHCRTCGTTFAPVGFA